MRRPRFVAALAAVSCFFSAWPGGLAKPPAVTSIFPAGGKTGSMFELTAADAPDPWEPVPQMLDQPIPEESKRKIFWDNSVALYGDRLLKGVNVAN